MAAPKAVRIELSESERVELQVRLRRRRVAWGDAQRAEIVLLAAVGLSNLAITERLGVARMTVVTWRGALPSGSWTACLTNPVLILHDFRGSPVLSVLPNPQRKRAGG